MHKLKAKLSGGSSSSKPKRVERAQSDAARTTNDDEFVRMSKQVAEDAQRFQRNTAVNTSATSATSSSYMSDDVEDVFYTANGARATNGAAGRGTDTYSNARATGGGGLRVTDVYRTTEQLRGASLVPLHEDQVFPAAARATATTTPSTTTGTTSPTMTPPHALGGPLDVLRAELADVRLEVQAIRRELMNEMHVTRYDVLKEVTMLKGTILTLVAALESQGVRALDSGARSTTAFESSSPTELLSSDELATISRATSVRSSRATKTRLAATRDDAGPAAIVRASARLTQLAPVADDALSTPLLQHQIDDFFPLVDSSAELETLARTFDPSTREWALERVQDWLDTRFNGGADNLLALVGDGGSGKSTFTATLVVDRVPDHIAAVHVCQFDRKAKSSPRNVLLSVVNQLVTTLPGFKNQLARLNLRYVLEEADPLVLARKVLVDPLCALDEPSLAKVLVVDGLDQCKARGRNELLDFLSDVLPDLPPWLGVFVTSKPSPELPAKLAITSLLDFSAKNAQYMDDTVVLLNDLMGSFRDQDVAEARELLKRKSGGNFTFLDFTRQALSHPGMEDAGSGYIALDVLHDLPETVYEIYDEIFEDKFGQGRSRLWKKVQPLLELIVTAASGPYALITEAQAQEQLALSKDDVRNIRRAFVDVITVRHGTYRLDSSALFDWLVDPTRADEQFFVDVSGGGMNALRQLHRQESAGDAHSVASSGGSSDKTASSNVSTASSYQSFVVAPPAPAKVTFKQPPTSILKKK